MGKLGPGGLTVDGVWDTLKVGGPMAESMQENVDVLERGNVYFLYRPKVDQHEPEGEGDLQNVYVVLAPDQPKHYRLLVVGRKRLPDPKQAGRERAWAFVDAVFKDSWELSNALEQESYQTKTRGERERPAARPAGEGVYEIARRGGNTHLAYVLELPETPGDVQQELKIETEADYVLSVKNPDAQSPPQAGLRNREAKLPKKLLERFEGRKFTDVDPPEFLDHEGVELMLVAAASDLDKRSTLPQEAEQESDFSADVFRDLKLRKSKHPVRPLFEGRWS